MSRPFHAPRGLDALLQALRAAGLPVGARELLRLRHVFALAPALAQDRAPGEQLRDLLASALVHDPDERKLFESVYEPWAERWQDWARPAAEQKLDESAPFPLPPGPRREAERRASRRTLVWVAARLAAVALLALAILRPAGPRPADDGAAASGSAAEGPDAAPSAVLGTFKVWVRSRDPLAEARRWQPSWPSILLGGLALGAAGGLAWRYGRKPWIPEVLPEPRPGPLRLPLLPLAGSGPELLDPDAAQTLIWGVGRHVSERLTRELDLDATVRRTAEGGGLPELRFAPEKRLREVWLWLDGTSGGEAMERWAGEVAASLAGAGLPVRRGGFDGLPELLEWDEGQVFAPREVEAHRQTALVAVCTDGAVLREELDLGGGARSLLRALAAWPRLVFVDFGDRGELAETLAALGLPCVEPADLPAHFGLGGAPPGAREAEVDPGEVRTWRAALALGGRSVDRELAWAMRRELDLELSPWDAPLLGAGEPSDPEVPAARAGGLAWSGEGWTALVGWLAEASFDGKGGIVDGSPFDKALRFWGRRLEDEAGEREERRDLDGWSEALAERHLAMERALLRLWREPAEAAEELYGLASGELRDELRERLGRMSPRDAHTPGDRRAPLPWRLDDLGDRTRYLLARLGLGGIRRGDLRRPGRLGMALGTLTTLGLVLVAWGSVPRPVPSPASAPEDERLAVRIQDVSPGAGWVETRFVSLASGTFWMGSEVDDPMAFADERPAHQVTVGELWMAETEVTNAQYRALRPEHDGPDDLPANVSWFEARKYCQSLGESDRWEFDLPTEAEWEYAARAGTRTPWSHGAKEEELDRYAWFRVNSSLETHRVRQKAPNRWLLYDMHGNVWEWALDCWNPDAYQERAVGQPIPDPWFTGDSCRGNEASSARVLRGGSFADGARLLRSAYRNRDEPELSAQYVGFRCVRRPVLQP